MTYQIAPALPEDCAEQLSSFHPIVQQILFRAGVRTRQEAQAFLLPQYTDISDPALFADIDQAAGRIIQAVENQEHIGIYADYDADGIPGACVVYQTLAALGVSDELVTVYIPHRHYEGYGVHQQAVEKLKSEGVQVLITVDVGITEYTTLGWIQEQGVDVILTDHHEMPAELPQVHSIIHPARDPYPDPKLCGAAVAFQLMRHTLTLLRGRDDLPDRIRVPHDGWEKWLLDLVGMATLTDMVPLVQENRALAWYGMQVMHKSRNHGIQAICAGQRMRPASLTEQDVVFSITPRLNAASRMDHPMRAFELLQASSDEKAKASARLLDSLNTRRKTTVARIMKVVHKRFDGTTPPPVVVVGERDWEQGVLGLIASKIVEAYGVSAFVWSEQKDGVIKGSCRSANGVHLVGLMRACPAETWLHFGGHAGAGGFALTTPSLIALQGTLNDTLESNRDSIVSELDETVSIDMVLSPDDINAALYDSIRSCAPFGVGNPEPTLAFRVIVREVTTFGKQKDHLKLMVTGQRGHSIEAIKFFSSVDDLTFLPPDGSTQEVYIIGTLERSQFMGRSNMRIKIQDIVEEVG